MFVLGILTVETCGIIIVRHTSRGPGLGTSVRGRDIMDILGETRMCTSSSLFPLFVFGGDTQ